MKTIIKYNDKLLDRLSIFFKIGGITLYPYIILREKYRDWASYKEINERVIRHESIHIEQQKELFVIGFYILYIVEFILRFLLCWNFSKAYAAISFEKEAHSNDTNENYLNTRKHFNFLKYIK